MWTLASRRTGRVSLIGDLEGAHRRGGVAARGPSVINARAWRVVSSGGNVQANMLKRWSGIYCRLNGFTVVGATMEIKTLQKKKCEGKYEKKFTQEVYSNTIDRRPKKS